MDIIKGQEYVRYGIKGEVPWLYNGQIAVVENVFGTEVLFRKQSRNGGWISSRTYIAKFKQCFRVRRTRLEENE